MLGNLVCRLMHNTREHHTLYFSFYLQERPSWPRNQQRSPSTSRWCWSRSWRKLWKMPLTQRCVILQVRQTLLLLVQLTVVAAVFLHPSIHSVHGLSCSGHESWSLESDCYTSAVLIFYWFPNWWLHMTAFSTAGYTGVSVGATIHPKIQITYISSYL